MGFASYYMSTFCKGIILLLLLQICTAELISESHVRKNATPTWVEKLRKDLLSHYDKGLRPAAYDVPIKIRIHLEITHIELESLTGIFTLYGRLLTEWDDSKLVWNRNQYGNVDLLSVADTEIWLPDLVLYNSALKDSAEYYGKSQCYVKSNGHVTWIPYVRYQLFCEMDTRMWPFDSHQCRLILGSWTFSEWHIDLELKEQNGSVVNLLVKNNEWKISNISAARSSKLYSCCEAPYVSVSYNVTIERRSAMYKTVLYTPTICIILLTLSCFWLPPHSGEKILLNGLCLVLVIMFMRYFAAKLPSLALSTPVIVSFYSSTLVFVTISTVISVAVLAISKSKHTGQVPMTIRNLLKGCLGKFLGVANLKSRVEQSELKEQPLSSSKAMDTSSLTHEFYQSDWISLASAIDRMAFIVYCIGFSLILISVYM